MKHISEHREFTRISMSVRVEITLPGEQMITGQVEDISMNGIHIVANHSFDPGATYRIKLILGGDKHEPEAIEIEAQGHAVRSDGSHLAIRFESLDLEGYQHLKQMLLSHASDSDTLEQEFEDHIGLRKKER